MTDDLDLSVLLEERINVPGPEPCELPVLPLANTVVFPQVVAPLFVSRQQAQHALDAALANDRMVLTVVQRDEAAEVVGAGDLYPIGVQSRISRVVRLPDGTINILLQGLWRVSLDDIVQEQPLLRARVTPIADLPTSPLGLEAARRTALALFEKVANLSRTLPENAYVAALNVETPGVLADLIASHLPLDVRQRQEVLEVLDVEQRLHLVCTLLIHELDVLQLEHQLRVEVEQEVDRTQRELFLREQLKAIQRELGHIDPLVHELAGLAQRIATANMPEPVQLRAQEELARLEAMPPSTPEYTLVRTYLDWLVALPWHATSGDTYELQAAAQTLDRHHYGLQKVKDRILEHLAVRKLTGARSRSPVLCFVGPPGVGKTSLGRSIAEALGRKFMRISLGGVHDEAEIRGHRRTYVGAMPGRIVKMMRDAGTVNPVLMLDEIDKLGHDFRGDPAAALLEVLDPEQNHAFSDHYLDVPYDLSRVMFITTANLLDPIPDALVDRLEVIELAGYTEEEKVEIARRFLIPQQLEANGLAGVPVRFGQDTIVALIRLYTYEAGVRELERQIGTVCRKIARRVAEQRRHPHRIVPSLLPSLLGADRYDYGLAEEHDEVGVATGMVWTANGGDVMPVEISVVEGKGNLLLTGQLGEVMQESAQAALSYTRANAKRLGIDPKRFDKVDIHVHMPDGAVPKEGPSAGITIACALVSALTNIPLKRTVAMTGEITLRGRILPVGGIKEKLLGAYRAGITRILMPRKNERDLEDIARHVRRKLQCALVQHMDAVLPEAFVRNPLDTPYQPRKRTRKKAASTAASTAVHSGTTGGAGNSVVAVEV
ncbi:MAG: endopeptidase La [Chloroflexi bacterium]|nr:MAG: endopeptidase La [Chloroflexota bacterium]